MTYQMGEARRNKQATRIGLFQQQEDQGGIAGSRGEGQALVTRTSSKIRSTSSKSTY
jgi:hypothetical protein